METKIVRTIEGGERTLRPRHLYKLLTKSNVVTGCRQSVCSKISHRFPSSY